MNVTSYLIEAHIFREKDNDIEFLLMKRAKSESYAGVWQMITGKVRGNEKAFETALREIKEETALIPEKFWVVPFVNSFYSHDDNSVCMVPVFAALVRSNSDIIISSEHSEYKWVNKDQAKKMLAWQGQRTSVETIYEYFINKKSTLEFVEIKN